MAVVNPCITCLLQLVHKNYMMKFVGLIDILKKMNNVCGGYLGNSNSYT